MILLLAFRHGKWTNRSLSALSLLKNPRVSMISQDPLSFIAFCL